VWTTLGRALVVVAVLATTLACTHGGPGDRTADPDPSRSGLRSMPPEAYTLRADGTVPWVDEPIGAEELYGRPRAPRIPAPGSRPCRAEQLAAALTAWRRPGRGGETPRGFDAAVDKLIGEVDIHNTSTVECTLRGETPTRMLSAGQQISMQYEHGIDAEAQRRVVVVPAGEHASLRLDWSGLFCQPVNRPLELAIDLPDRGGTLHAPVTATETPRCTGGEGVNPNARSTLYASGFSEPALPAAPQDSPLSGVTIAVSGPDTAPAGAPVVYQVTMSNPTAMPIPLDPCPGYLVELFSMGDASAQPVNTSLLYRLNCRPVHTVPAGGSVRFEMVAQVPADMATNRVLSLTWRLTAPRFVQGPVHWGLLNIRVQ